MSEVSAIIMPENILWIFVDCFLFVAIVLGNVLTIVAIAMTRRLKSVVSNYFVFNLAVSDLLVGITLPYHLAFYVHDPLSHTFSICISRFVLTSVACGGSIYNIMVIAIDRYIAIVHPLSYNAYATRRRVLLIIAGTWFCTISVSSIPIYWHRFSPNSTCEFETVFPRNYIAAVQMPSFLFAWVTMFLLYLKIWKEAQMCVRRMNLSIVSNFTEKNDRGSVHVVLMILGCFTICWLPYLVVASMRSFNWMRDSTNTWYKATFALALANSGMNPLIYTWKNTSFRRAFQRILRFKSPNNKLNSSLKVFLEQQHNEIKNKQKDAENEPSGNSGLHGYSSEQQNNRAEETGVENTTL
ncbi:tyramine/octopamine receptor [Odontomachus brunneus]|uniref:tyramine/octopamine receptor n=1 Tax=Odontomachus brunneus TaxID=486640 RepID=UPI0013F1D877|nr:tyramine/octopamine receptor [Odontomachus brunneus]XP_032672969.1 tyramine/octopamine receptor [Odontomachus brunneus]XP_032672970.1 tyramine/octopamine receptor [Odontomachus brunneus]XP_032672971.1 tyramine/octopamine receptor [Odontomachus brunneus]XP_032672972.1 tyramine/octopamine receptor [Odontomachus brunneus]XP_032672973.1 tyramine/octopamine receptor [Odontomachus brunneus]